LENLKKACEGIDVVFHTAAIILTGNLPHEYDLMQRVNYEGTLNVIAACVACNVKALIYTSTSHVILSQEMHGQTIKYTEDNPYSTNPFNHYVRTKIKAEKEILKSNGRNGLMTVSIRPASGVFGCQDLVLAPVITRKTIVCIGDLYLDWIYVDNLVHAEFLAEKGLFQKQKEVSGQVFLVSNNEPVHFQDFYARMKSFEPDLKYQTIPYSILFCLSWFSWTVQTLFGKSKWLGELAGINPATLNATGIDYICVSKKAKEILGYTPLYSLDEGIQKSIDEIHELYR